jgi:oligosaccharide repeat unit polymerase
MIQFFLLLLLIAGVLFSLKCNRDIFSPAKFYQLSLTVFFLDIFLSEHKGYVYAVYAGYILVGFLISMLEVYMRPPSGTVCIRSQPSDRVPARFVVILWAISMISILAYAGLIHLSGGFESLTEIIAFRVAKWKGLGLLVAMAKLIGPINLVYFTLGLVYTQRNPRLWWMLYGLHLLLFMGNALLLGGRSFMLMQPLLMIVIYNYLRKPIRIRVVLVAGTLLLVAASFLGTVRNHLTRLDSAHDLFDIPDKIFNLKMFSYGTMPLDIVFTREFSDCQYGTTYLSALTNFIPRKIWPGKFDPGGVVLTKFAYGHSYTGTYNLSPGIVAEAILNFGPVAGIFCGFAILLIVSSMMVWVYYRLLRNSERSEGLNRILSTVLYVYLAIIPGTLLWGEFTTIFVGRTMRIAFLLMIIIVLKVRMKTAEIKCTPVDYNQIDRVSVLKTEGSAFL